MLPHDGYMQCLIAIGFRHGDPVANTLRVWAINLGDGRALADEVASLGYDRILFVPTGIAPHKEMAFEVGPEVRAAMVDLAVEDDSRFFLEKCEVERGGTSYTWDTICFLEKKYEGMLDGKIGLIIGYDQAATFHLWKNARELSEKCQLIIGRRPDQKEDESFSNKATGGYASAGSSGCEKIDFHGMELLKDAVFLENEFLAVSSTGIRTRAAKGLPFRYLVPQKVFKYIMDGNIYGKH